jgi:hypothetical protein
VPRRWTRSKADERQDNKHDLEYSEPAAHFLVALPQARSRDRTDGLGKRGACNKIAAMLCSMQPPAQPPADAAQLHSD